MYITKDQWQDKKGGCEEKSTGEKLNCMISTHTSSFFSAVGTNIRHTIAKTEICEEIRKHHEFRKMVTWLTQFR